MLCKTCRTGLPSKRVEVRPHRTEQGTFIQVREATCPHHGVQRKSYIVKTLRGASMSDIDAAFRQRFPHAPTPSEVAEAIKKILDFDEDTYS